MAAYSRVAEEEEDVQPAGRSHGGRSRMSRDAPVTLVRRVLSPCLKPPSRRTSLLPLSHSFLAIDRSTSGAHHTESIESCPPSLRTFSQTNRS